MPVIRTAPHVVYRLSGTVAVDSHDDLLTLLKKLLRRYESAVLGCIASITLPIEKLMLFAFPYKVQINHRIVHSIVTLMEKHSNRIVHSIVNANGRISKKWGNKGACF
jgi:hypothetical protein